MFIRWPWFVLSHGHCSLGVKRKVRTCDRSRFDSSSPTEERRSRGLDPSRRGIRRWGPPLRASKLRSSADEPSRRGLAGHGLFSLVGLTESTLRQEQAEAVPDLEPATGKVAKVHEKAPDSVP